MFLVVSFYCFFFPVLAGSQEEDEDEDEDDDDDDDDDDDGWI